MPCAAPLEAAALGIELAAIDPPRAQIEMSRFIRCARMIAVDSAGTTMASQRR